ncbi:MAG: hypothetical protein AB8I08_06140 [Sandaracinaceae bacterium]
MRDAQDSKEAILLRRARRCVKKGDYRGAAVALKKRVSIVDDAPSWVQLGDMLRRARREQEALRALKQALYRHRRAGALGRVRTVARMIVDIDPRDAQAQRHVLH